MGKLNLSEKEKVLVSKTLRKLGAQRDDIGYYISYWSNFTDLLKNGYEGSVYSYSNSLDIRSRISEMLKILPDSTAKKIETVVHSIDTLFLSYTQESQISVPWKEDYPDEAWVNRLPKTFGLEKDFKQYLTERGLLP